MVRVHAKVVDTSKILQTHKRGGKLVKLITKRAGKRPFYHRKLVNLYKDFCKIKRQVGKVQQ